MTTMHWAAIPGRSAWLGLGLEAVSCGCGANRREASPCRVDFELVLD
jgi:hypothetical protein